MAQEESSFGLHHVPGEKHWDITDDGKQDTIEKKVNHCFGFSHVGAFRLQLNLLPVLEQLHNLFAFHPNQALRSNHIKKKDRTSYIWYSFHHFLHLPASDDQLNHLVHAVTQNEQQDKYSEQKSDRATPSMLVNCN